MPRSRARFWSSISKLLKPKRAATRKLGKLTKTWAKLWRTTARPTAQPVAPSPAIPSRGAMTPRYLTWEGTRRAYLLFEPSPQEGVMPPLLVMLHGCKQTAADFSMGTRMNEVADRYGFAVAYPEQPRSANKLQCWNWFDRRHQGRRGEASMLASLALDAQRKVAADPSRIFIAGLSAGGAMALVAASAHPEVFSAVGCHSGVPEGVAGDVFGALRVMRNGPSPSFFGTRFIATGARFVPTIVFHGNDDQAVHPRNGEAIFQAALTAAETSNEYGLLKSETTAASSGGARSARIDRVSDPQGNYLIEAWTVDGLGHAWSGGSADGSFADPRGPDASEAMVKFFAIIRT